MKYLGLDLGTSTCGTAITDKTNTLVIPYKLIKFKTNNYNKALNEVINIVKTLNIDIVVLGFPKNMDNTLGDSAKRSLNFKKMLEDEGIHVELQDERRSTIEAINIMKSNGIKRINKSEKTDIIAATIILDSYLKRINYGK